MDIEGAEYDILENLNANIKNLKNIKHIFIEFHSRFMKLNDRVSYKIRENKIKNELKKNKINFTIWI